MSLVHAFINVYVVAVHLLFAKELSVFSKLLISHNSWCKFFSHFCYVTPCSSVGLPGDMLKYPLLFYAVNNGF